MFVLVVIIYLRPKKIVCRIKTCKEFGVVFVRIVFHTK